MIGFSSSRVRQFIRMGLIGSGIFFSFLGQGVAEITPLQQNPVKFGIRSFDGFAGQNIAPAFFVAKETYQNIQEQEIIEPNRIAGLRKFRAGDEIYSVLSRRNSLQKSIPSTGILSRRTSRIRGKDMTVVKMRQGDKVISMDVFLGAVRSLKKFHE